MIINLGISEASLLDPPNEGTVVEATGREWKIRRTGVGLIVIRDVTDPLTCHPDFLPNGMDMLQFCQWINKHL